ncbi:uncharacterized protein LOC110990081 [Acanthaster planci]|uniref:Uncharacterized protein LOC110990081 n=1 Tax=Acanthaster planci TaxID=133434 RepID=A0A8B8A3V7_ACAPL|nr:uncharacterized protein LOC110990081 [Acanthaster planci]XP_022110582.1 uncharacterized protein LOC110990081 [Acanthaster planci]XP_022110583.1 uncharacterized protein LOC110990081 [Acanthaster planci]
MEADQPPLEERDGAQEQMTVASPLDDIESICSELENVQLTDDETTTLLHEALELNKRLKEELRRREVDDGRARDATVGGAGVGRRGDAVSASLPPIHPKKGLSVTQRRIYNSVEMGERSHKTKNRRVAVGAGQRKAHSADGGHQQTASPLTRPRARGTQSAESKQRPEWNDRFSF